ncbi:MAG: hypothetical protein ACP5O7_10695 [Phycisphaerae bacterium]
MIVFDMSQRQIAWYIAAATILGGVALLTATLLERHFGFVRSIVFTGTLGTILFPLMAVSALSARRAIYLYRSRSELSYCSR